MKPYVVRQGDYLAQIAHRLGFDADAVWNDPKNEPLRKIRSDPNLLCSGDVLYVPEPKRTWLAVNSGAVNQLVATIPVIKVQVVLKKGGAPIKSAAYTVVAGDFTSKGSTSDGGIASFEVPVHAGVCVLTLTETQRVYRLLVGHMDPSNEPSGAWKRLEHLGYLAGPRAVLPGAVATAALKRFQNDSGLTASGELDDATMDALKKSHGS